MISAAFDLKLNYRLFRNPSTLYSILSLVSFFYPFRARYFSIIGSRSVFADPHQSPIRFKAIVLFKRKASKHGPWSSWTPENHRYVECSIGWVTNLVVISQPLMD